MIRCPWRVWVNQQLLETLDDDAADAKKLGKARLELVEHLLDRHGTGRVLFRNTRAAIKGFPDRQVAQYALPLPDAYRHCLADIKESAQAKTAVFVTPERLYQDKHASGKPHWTRIDPRLPWLLDILHQLRPHKILLITAHADTVLDIAAALKTRAGIHAAVFHEGMSILERDRAAAYFADRESGTQLMICSEIGSEGRNFQFAHQLILFDLPLNPDLLEQRIGRLDRIGQTETIRIHVPCLEGSPQSVLFRWYHEGLGAFEHTCPAGHAVFEKIGDDLLETLAEGCEVQTDRLLATTRRHRQALNEALHQGRDRLLEYNSCRPRLAKAIWEQATREDRTSTLPAYMDSIFDCYGVQCEEHSAHCHVIRPGESMLTPFPGLADDGMTITYDRATALANENIHFLTWDHPMVTAAMEMVLNSELGNTALVAARLPGFEAGALLLECIFCLAPVSSESLQTSRYMPPAIIRILMDENGADHGSRISCETISLTQLTLDKEIGRQLLDLKAGAIRQLASLGEKAAQRQAPQLLEEAHVRSRHVLMKELNRLQALSQVNPGIRREEIAYFKKQLDLISRLIDHSTPRMDSLRVIITT